MASRRLEDLNEPTRKRAQAFLDACHAAGLDVLIYCTLRSREEQNELFTHGRTAPGPVVTMARGGDSWHNYGSAFDFVPLVNGKPKWADMDLYTRCGEIAEKCGLEWAGRWKGQLRETAHCQYRGGLSLADAKAGRLAGA